MADEESNDLESYIKQENEETSDDASSLLDDNNDSLLENNEDESLSESVKEANESILTGDPDPFNKQNFERINTTLTKIEEKIDQETEQLKKLDVLEDIKTEIQKMNENSLEQSTNLTPETSPSAGHNLPNTDELLNRIDEIENKIQTGSANDELQESINNLSISVQELKETTETYNKRFERLESSISRFEEMEKDIRLEVVDEDDDGDSETITAFDENDEVIHEEKIKSDDKIENKPIETKEQKRKNILYLTLIILIMLITAAIILDRLKIVDLYLDSIFRIFF